MRWNLLPTEPYFFEAFLRFTRELQRGSELLITLLSTHPVPIDIVSQIRDAEHSCDKITHEIIQKLNQTFVTPIDREDVHALAAALDDVMDAIEAASALIPLHRIEHIRGEAADLAKVIAKQSEQLVIAAERLPKMLGLPEEIRAIGLLEKTGDQLHQDAVGRLFDEERDPIEVIKWKEIFDFLEDACDRALEAAHVLENIYVKHG